MSLLFPPYLARVKVFAGFSTPLGMTGIMQNYFELRYMLSFNFLATSDNMALATSSSFISI
jgi:hypothetical protein